MTTIKRAILRGAAVTALMTAGAGAAAAQSDRLSHDVVPKAYRLDLTVIPERERLTGHVEIDVDLKTATDQIILHGRGLDVTKVSAVSGRSAIDGRFSQSSPSGRATLQFGHRLAAGKVTLRFDYTAPFASGSNGAYRTEVDGAWYVWSHFEAVDARSAFPGFDEPGFKTPFTLTLRTRPNDVAVSNTPETAQSLEGGLAVHRFAQTAPLPTYLFAFDVGPFAHASAVVPANQYRPKPFTMRVFATKPNADKLAFAASNSGPILSLLETYFARPLPFSKLDQMASPVMQGGMENAGASLFGDQFLLVTDSASNGRKHMFGDVVAHETAHQWFGDLVTPAWWDDIWLNESFANWMGHKISDEWRPDLTQNVGIAEEGFYAMDTDGLIAGRPIRARIDKDGDIEDSFDEITYGKGAQVIAMFAGYLGDQTFRDGVRRYLAAHAYGSATSEDFYKALADAAGDPKIVASLKSFVEQQGVPVVVVERRDGAIHLSQKPYAAIGATSAARTWSIPVCLSVAGVRQCVMVGSEPVTLKDPGGVLMPNAGGTGYFRFELSEADWRALIGGAATMKAPEALAVLDSLWAGFRAGDVQPSLLLDAARGFSTNPYSGAALGATRRLISLAHAGIIGEGDRASLDRLIHDLFASRLAELGTDLSADAYAKDTPERRSMRSGLLDMLAFDGEDTALRTRLSQAAQRYLGGETASLDGAFLVSGLRAYLLDKGPEAEDDLYRRAIAATDSRLRAEFVEALTASGRADVGARVAEQVSTGEFRTIERVQLVQGLISEPGTRELGVNLLSTQFASLLKDGTGPGSRVLLSAPSQFCSADQADQIEQKLRTFATANGIGTLPLDRAVERAKNCAIVAKARSGAVHDALLALPAAGK